VIDGYTILSEIHCILPPPRRPKYFLKSQPRTGHTREPDPKFTTICKKPFLKKRVVYFHSGDLSTYGFAEASLAEVLYSNGWERPWLVG
jgi:hypothetical protein